MTDDVVTIEPMAAGRRRDEQQVCRAPSCWRDGTIVRVAGETDVAAVLCETHAKSFLGVSS